MDKATKDPRVKALYVHLPEYRSAGGFAQIQEIKQKIEEFKSANKIAIAYSSEYNQSNYYLATSFSKIYMQPVGHLFLQGFNSTTLFYKGLLDKLNIIPRFVHAGDFKTAPNVITEHKFTPEHKLQVESLIGNIYKQLIEGISINRNIPSNVLEKLVNDGPFFGEEAFNNKLVDGLQYEDEIIDGLKSAIGDNTNIINFKKYSIIANKEQDKKNSESNNRIALIYAVGNIVPDVETQEPASITPRQMNKAFQMAIDDEKVKAIVIRIDSPGGSAIASDTIWRYVIHAQKSGKKVIASVGDVSASGGYYIMSPCDKIVCQPGSITGSIGVFSGKFLLSDFLENKLGITHDSVIIGDNSNALSPFHDFTPAQLTRFQQNVEQIYDVFLDRVSTGRKLSKEKVIPQAGGRVFTGIQAKQVGLIDELGGLDKAVDIARDLVNDSTAQVVVYPRRLPLFKQIKEIMEGNGDSINVQHVMLEALYSSHLEFLYPKIQPWMKHLFNSPNPSVMAVASNIPQQKEK